MHVLNFESNKKSQIRIRIRIIKKNLNMEHEFGSN